MSPLPALNASWSALRSHPAPLLFGGVAAIVATVLLTPSVKWSMNYEAATGDASTEWSFGVTGFDTALVDPSWLTLAALGFAAGLKMLLGAGLWVVAEPGYVVAQRDALRGQSAGLGGYWAHAGIIPRVAATWVVVLVIIGLAAAVGVGPGALVVGVAYSQRWPLVQAAGVLIGAVGFSVSTGWAGTPMLFASRHTTLDDASPSAAIIRSWRAVRRHRWRLIALAVSIFAYRAVAVVLGCLTCGVGWLLLGPAVQALTDTSLTHAYLTIRDPGDR